MHRIIFKKDVSIQVTKGYDVFSHLKSEGSSMGGIRETILCDDGKYSRIITENFANFIIENDSFYEVEDVFDTSVSLFLGLLQ